MIHIEKIIIADEGNQHIELDKTEIKRLIVFINGLMNKRQKKSRG